MAGEGNDRYCRREVSQAAIDSVPLWYHTLELPDGLLTPGWFDLRQQVASLPWPDVAGKRCLDVGTYDGFYAFELERRGAEEVVATDISDHEDWDWPAAARAGGGAALAPLAGEKGRGFEVARTVLGSRVRRLELSAYHLSAERIGTFDVVVCGSLMLHLRDPVRALEAIRSVCRGWFLSVEEVSLRLTTAFPHRPVADMRFNEELCQWWVVNGSGLKRMVEIAGFEVARMTRPFIEPFGPGYPARNGRPAGVWAGLKARSPLGRGVPHAALLARPRVQAPPVNV
jgi:tRNA (mo5U34)-methyltransferase